MYKFCIKSYDNHKRKTVRKSVLKARAERLFWDIWKVKVCRFKGHFSYQATLQVLHLNAIIKNNNWKERKKKLSEGNQVVIYKSDRGCTLETTDSN